MSDSSRHFLCLSMLAKLTAWPCADLHPGNILVRVVDPNSTWGRIANFCRFKTAPHLVLLDVGMTCELTPDEQRNIVGFFQASVCSCTTELRPASACGALCNAYAPASNHVSRSLSSSSAG